MENFNQARCVSSAIPSPPPAGPACLFRALEETRENEAWSNFRTGNCNENIPKFKAIGRESDVVAQRLDFPLPLKRLEPRIISWDIFMESRLSSLLSESNRNSGTNAGDMSDLGRSVFHLVPAILWNWDYLGLFVLGTFYLQPTRL